MLWSWLELMVTRLRIALERNLDLKNTQPSPMIVKSTKECREAVANVYEVSTARAIYDGLRSESARFGIALTIAKVYQQSEC